MNTAVPLTKRQFVNKRLDETAEFMTAQQDMEWLYAVLDASETTPEVYCTAKQRLDRIGNCLWKGRHNTARLRTRGM